MGTLIAGKLVAAASLIIAQTPTDYPGSATEHGSVRVNLTISTEGRVAACQIDRPSGVTALDEAACKIAARARFRPATDAENQPTASEYQLTIHFLTPGMQLTNADLPITDGNEITILYQPVNAPGGDLARAAGMADPPKRLPTTATPPYPFKALRNNWQGRTGVIVGVNDKGHPTSCDLVRTSGYTILDQQVCRFVLKEVRYIPAKDIYGLPMSAYDFVNIAWSTGYCATPWSWCQP